MARDFDLLWKVAINEIAALAGCSVKVARRDFYAVYTQAAKDKKAKKRRTR